MLCVRVAVPGVFVPGFWKTSDNLNRQVQLHGLVADRTFNERVRVTDSDGFYPPEGSKFFVICSAALHTTPGSLKFVCVRAHGRSSKTCAKISQGARRTP